MQVYLIRHTTPDIASGICYGQTDIPLRTTFTEEVKRVIKAIPKPLDMVYSSPLTRCLALAKRLNADQLIKDRRLMELNFGQWEMKPWDALPKDQLEAWMKDFVHHAPLQGESMVQLQERVIEWWSELARTENQEIGVVTHAGVIRVLKAHLNKTPLSASFSKIQVNYGEVVCLKYS